MITGIIGDNIVIDAKTIDRVRDGITDGIAGGEMSDMIGMIIREMITDGEVVDVIGATTIRDRAGGMDSMTLIDKMATREMMTGEIIHAAKSLE
jgi:hypothetical protein